MGKSFGTPRQPSHGHDTARGDLVIIIRNSILPYRHLSNMIGIVIELPLTRPRIAVSVFLNPYKILLGNRVVYIPANLVQNII